MDQNLLPSLGYESWRDTRDTLHRFLQLVGKVRLAASPRRNHWWNVAFHLTGRGVTTRPMGRDPIFAIDFDFLDHRLDIATADGRRHAFALPGLSVAAFADRLAAGLAAVGVDVRVATPYPFDLPDSDRPFTEDTEHAAYDTVAVTRYWRILSQVNLLLEEFAGRWSGKTSPVHHFWHTLDIVLTRYPEEQAGVPGAAHTWQEINFGFWFGDPTVPEPAFYSYTAPEPDRIAAEPLAPAGATWLPRNERHLAVLRYEQVRAMTDPHAGVLDFYESAFRAGTRRGAA
jgi:hypothetical protein